MLQIKALHRDYVALQNQILKKNLQAASKEVQAFIKIVQQKSGQSIIKIIETGYTLWNLSGSHIFYKPENSEEALRLENFGMLFSTVDGIATPYSNNRVLKISDLNVIGSLGLTIMPGGLPTCLNYSMLGMGVALIEMASWAVTSLHSRLPGWKDREWLAAQQNKSDNGWNALFEAAATF